MSKLKDRIHIRHFQEQDANRCFKIRSAAFIQKFYSEIGARATSAGVNAFMPDDYIQMAQKTPFFVAQDSGDIIGFFTIARKNNRVAEIPLIYIDLNHLGKKVGRTLIGYIEQWVITNWPDVTTLIVDTVIPEYNSAFYQKAGFSPAGKTICHFPAMDVPAVRLEKTIGHRRMFPDQGQQI